MEEPVKYLKQKYVYLLTEANSDVKLCFGNIKAAIAHIEEWTTLGKLNPLSYDRVVTGLRTNGYYSVVTGKHSITLYQVKLVGHTVRTAKRQRSVD